MHPIKSTSNKAIMSHADKHESSTGFIASLLPSFEIPSFAEKINFSEAAKGIRSLFSADGILRTAFQAYTAFSLINAASAAPLKEEIAITNCKDLNHIGDIAGGLPKDGKYVLKHDIDCSDQRYYAPAAKIEGGELDGKGHAIVNLGTCLFEEIKDGAVHHLTIKDSVLDSVQTCVLSDTVSGNSTISDIIFKDVKLRPSITTKNSAGLLARTVTDKAQVKDVKIESSSLHVVDSPLKVNAGLLASSAEGDASISNIKIKDSTLSVPLSDHIFNAYGDVGGCVGSMSGNSKADLIVNKNISVVTLYWGGTTGGAVGMTKGSSSFTNTLVYESSITAQGSESHLGAVIGSMGSNGLQSNLNSYKNKVESCKNGRSGGLIGKVNVVATKVTDLFSVENTVACKATDNCLSGGLIGQIDIKVADGFSVNNTATNGGERQTRPIDGEWATGSTVSNEVDCTKSAFDKSFFNPKCDLKVNETLPVTAAMSQSAMGSLAGVATGVALGLAFGGAVYLVRKYVYVEKAEQTDQTSENKITLEPVTEL